MRMVEIEATNRCNTHCLHCPREAISRPLGTMSRDTYRVVSDKILSDGGFDAIYFSGMGEPTLNRHLAQFIARVSPHVPTVVTTNASTLSPDGIRDLVQAGLDTVIVSFTGHTPELYGLMSGGLVLSSFDEQVRDLVGIGNARLKVAANVSVTLQNRDHVGAMRDHLFQLGVHEISFAMCHNRGGFLDDPLICQTPFPPFETTRCDIFADTLYIAWDGSVLACCHDLAGQGCVGNLVTQDLDAILQTKRRIVREGVRFSMCDKCNDMYRFGSDVAPDGGSLSEWIYALCAGQGEAESKLLQVIRQQDARIRELENLVAGYERGRFIRFTKWLHAKFSAR